MGFKILWYYLIASGIAFNLVGFIAIIYTIWEVFTNYMAKKIVYYRRADKR